jgi:A/G-specific adenine glycosylase
VAAEETDFGPTEARLAAFIDAVRDHYRRHGRDLPWRRTRDPYEILVSEVMLQQTQVARVLVKYPEFLASFPTVAALSVAPAAGLLALWSGLGYNRRALALHQAARMVMAEHGGHVPGSPKELRRLPGVGPATAAAVCVFAFGMPHAFVETNIRAAFIHFFFEGCDSVADADIVPLVEKTMDREDPRHWFYALMDYGVWVKKAHDNPSRRSRHHNRQTPFAGSRRELRAQALQALLSIAPSAADAGALWLLLPGGAALSGPERLASVLDDLWREGFLERENGRYRIA